MPSVSTPESVASALLGIVVAYLSGALPWGLWLGRWFKRVDVRTLGSGNLGATNVYRSLGPVLGIATLLLDMAKGAVPIWLLPRIPLMIRFPGGPEWCAIVVGLAAISGHIWTVFAGFKGGKGVATTVGVLLALSPAAFGTFVAVFVTTVAVTRYISLASILGSLTFAATLAFTAPRGPNSPTFGFGVLVALLVIARHRDNIRRLRRGEERRFSLRSGRAA